MAWLLVLAIACASFGALWRFSGLEKGVLQLAAAAILIGLAGYAWQGSPGQPGVPARPKGDAAQPDSLFARARPLMMQRFSTAAQWLDYADALHRMGYDRSAVTAVKSGLLERPDDPDLWLGLGNALTLHAEGVVTPAALFAFERARALAPRHVGAQYFLGLAYAQSGDLAKADATWRALLAQAGPASPWRADLTQRLAALDAALGSSPNRDVRP